MFKRNKLLLILTIVFLVVIGTGATSFAASYDTGSTEYTSFVWMDDADPDDHLAFCDDNKKEYNEVNWKIRATTVYNIQGYGIRIYPLCVAHYCYLGSEVWINSASSSYTYGGYYTMIRGEWYDLKCRIDNDYPGTWMRAVGYWNAN